MTPSSNDVVLVHLDGHVETLMNTSFLNLIQESGEQVSVAGVTLAVKLRDKWWEYIGTQEGNRFYKER